MGLIFQDTFTAANGAAITSHTPDQAPAGGSYSTSGAASWAIQSNKLNATGIDGGTDVAVIDLGVRDGVFQADIATTYTNDSNRANAALVLRWTDANNFILLYFFNPSGGPPGIYAQTTAGGVTTQLGGVAMSLVSGTPHTLKAVFAGPSFTVYVDGVFSFSFTTATNATATKFVYFTNAVGTPPSSPTWDNVTFVAGDTSTVVPAYSIPIPHVPWLGRRLDATAQQSPPPSAASLPQTMPPIYNPFVRGLPISNVPWTPFNRVFPATAAVVPPLPVQQQPLAPYPVIPIFGVPWNRTFLAPALPAVQQQSIVPPSGMPAVWTSTAPGVPIFGVPWTFRVPGFSPPAQPSSPPLVPPPPTPGPGRPSKNKPFLPRVPDISTAYGQDRLRRFTELVQTIFNSLFGNGDLVQTGQNTYSLRSGGFSAPRAPTAMDDSSIGVKVGSVFVNTLNNSIYINVSSTIGSAVWVNLTGGLTGHFP
jgi:hypothetical protein